MFPRAAAANQPIFYDKSGDARSVGGVYAELTRRYQAAANSRAAQTAIAFAGGTPAAAPAMTVASTSPDQGFAASPQPSASQLFNASSTAVTPPQQVAAVSNDRPMFRSLFQVGDRADPISPTVRELWATGRGQVQGQLQGQVQASNPVNLAPDIKLKTPSPLDLFSDPNGTFAG